jgi:hypothetical protein
MLRAIAVVCLAVPLLALAQVVAAPALDNPFAFAKVVFSAVASGDWVTAAAAGVVLLIALVRLFGKKLHDFLPDHVLLDVPLYFLFDTKPGGILLNALVSGAAGVGSAMLAGVPVTWALLKPVLLVSFSASTIWGWAKDLWEWRQAKNPPLQAAPIQVVPGP